MAERDVAVDEGARRRSGRRLAVAVLAVLAMAGPAVAFSLWSSEFLTFTKDPTRSGLDADNLRRLLVLDWLYAALYAAVLIAICLTLTRDRVRYRAAGQWIAALAFGGAIADVMENVLLWGFLDGRDQGWRPYATAAKWGLLVVPLIFAVGALVAWVSRQTERRPSRLSDPRAVASAIDWAHAQPSPKLGTHLDGVVSAWLKGDKRRVNLSPPKPAEPKGLTGVCFSGGGIRSAAFNLGALQELQEAGELQRADLLTGVSGGGYMAGAYSLAAAHSDPEALGTLPPFGRGSPEEHYLRNRTTYLFPGLGGVGEALWRLVRGLVVNVGFIALVLLIFARPYGWAYSDQIKFSDRTTCESPVKTPASAGTTVVTGPAIPGCPPGESAVERKGTTRKVTFEAFGWERGLIAGVAGLALILGMVDLLLRPRERMSRWLEAWSLRALGLAVVLAVFLLLLPGLAARFFNDATLKGGAFDRAPTTAALTGAVSSLVSMLAILRRSGPKGASDSPVSGGSGIAGKIMSGARKAGDGLARLLMIVVGGIIAPVALLAGFLALAMGAMVGEGFRPRELFLWLLAVGVFLFVQGVGDANRWSLQPYYKRRLQTAFALKRTGDASDPEAAEIEFDKPLPFSSLLDAPQYVACAAANLGDYGLLPPGRPVTTFTFSRTEVCGGILGAMPTQEFAVLLGPHYERDFTVPAAMAASGAAVSPVMGKMTRHAARFLFALTNVRLGVWLPNPSAVLAWAQEQEPRPAPEPAPVDAVKAADAAHAEAREREKQAQASVASLEVAATATRAMTQAIDEPGAELAQTALAKDVGYERSALMAARLDAERARRALDEARCPLEVTRSDFTGFPSLPRPTKLFRELFGVYRARGRYVYVTDGGHYENLGLVELLRRGCTTIYCFDAAGDKTDSFSTFADAVAIARTELGVEVQLDPKTMAPEKGSPFNRAVHTSGEFTYKGSESAPGRLVLAKLGITKSLPPDVLSWWEKNPTFPTDGTADQLYTDQRFEAYRALGAYAARQAIAEMRSSQAQAALGNGAAMAVPVPAGGQPEPGLPVT